MKEIKISDVIKFVTKIAEDNYLKVKIHNLKYGEELNKSRHKEYKQNYNYNVISIHKPSGDVLGNIGLFNSYIDNYDWNTSTRNIKLLTPFNVSFEVKSKLNIKNKNEYVYYTSSRHRYKSLMKNYCDYYSLYKYLKLDKGIITESIYDTIKTFVEDIKLSLDISDVISKNEFSNSFFDNCILSDLLDVDDQLTHGFKVKNDNIRLNFHTDEVIYRYCSGTYYIINPDIPIRFEISPKIKYSSININDVLSKNININFGFYKLNNDDTTVYSKIKHTDFISIIEEIHSKYNITNISNKLNNLFKFSNTYKDIIISNNSIILENTDKYSKDDNNQKYDNITFNLTFELKTEDITDVKNDVSSMIVMINDIINSLMNIKNK